MARTRIKPTQVVLNTDGTLSGNSDTDIASQKATKTYADTKVAGAGTVVDSDFVLFSGTTGKIIKDTGLSFDTDGTMAANSDSRIPSQKAVRTYLASFGYVVGAVSSVDSDFVMFSGTSGKIIKDNSLSLDTDGTLAANSDSKIPSQKAVKTYAVTGPGFTVDSDFAMFSGTGGRTLKDNSLSLDTDGTLAANSDSKISSQKAVKTYVDTGLAGVSGNSLVNTITQTAHGFIVGDILYYTGSAWAKAKADNVGTAEVIGMVSVVVNSNNFKLHFGGYITTLSGLTAGVVYFLSDTVAGLLTATEPTSPGSFSKPLLVASTTSAGYFFNYRGVKIGALTVSQLVVNDGTADPPAGTLGEFLSSGSALVGSLTNNTWASVASVTLTPGSWDVQGVMVLIAAASTTVTRVLVGISTSLNGTVGVLSRAGLMWASWTPGTGLPLETLSPIVRIRVSANTVCYTNGFSNFATSTMAVNAASIFAVRVA